MIDPEFGKRLKKERENYFHGIPKTYYGAGRQKKKYISHSFFSFSLSFSFIITSTSKKKNMPKKHKIQVIFNEKELKIGVKDRKNKHGVSVRKILETSEAYGKIERGDIVTYVGEVSNNNKFMIIKFNNK